MRRVLLILVAAIAVLGGGAAAAWYLSVRSAIAGFEELAETLRVAGYDVSLGDVSVSGFPTATEATVDGLEIARPADSYAWRWTARQVQVTGRLDSGHVSFRVRGAQQLSYVVAGEERTARFGAQRFLVAIERGGDGRIERITADLGEFVLRAHGAEEALTARLVRAELTRASGAGAVPGGSAVSLRVDKLEAPNKRMSPLGSIIETFSAELVLQGGLDTIDLATALPAWRAAPEAGLRVGEARLQWGLLNLRADGTLTLDEQLRPRGRFTARIHNFVPALDAFYAAKRIDGAVRADYYAALLPHVQPPELQNFDAVLQLEDGSIRLLADGKGLGALTLGAVTPILQLPR